jgi:hypothetical protein
MAADSTTYGDSFAFICKINVILKPCAYSRKSCLSCNLFNIVTAISLLSLFPQKAEGVKDRFYII